MLRCRILSRRRKAGACRTERSLRTPPSCWYSSYATSTAGSGRRESSMVEIQRQFLSPDNPWPGLDPFDETDREYFHGRAAESGKLLRLVRREPLTVVFGRSGLGKTSLLKAGLFPLLRSEDCLPVYLRLDHAEGA